jgi:hypothetical protein
MIAKKVKVTEFNGALQLSIDKFNSELLAGPDAEGKPDAQELLRWVRSNEGRNTSSLTAISVGTGEGKRGDATFATLQEIHTEWSGENMPDSGAE